MARDPNVVGKTRVVAETLAEVVNGFVDVISFKTMVRFLPALCERLHRRADVKT